MKEIKFNAKIKMQKLQILGQLSEGRNTRCYKNHAELIVTDVIQNQADCD